jgi:hypothetical protein
MPVPPGTGKCVVMLRGVRYGEPPCGNARLTGAHCMTRLGRKCRENRFRNPWPQISLARAREGYGGFEQFAASTKALTGRLTSP